MGSLKAFLPSLAGLLGTTGDALYTRQRALAELGVLEVVKGRGPGSGTPLSAFGVAGILIAVLSADTLQETDKRVRSICRAVPTTGETCPLTGAADFQSALAEVLISPKIWKSLASVVVYRHSGAQILYGRPSESLGSVFDVHPVQPDRAIIRIAARIDAARLRQIAALMTAHLIL